MAHGTSGGWRNNIARATIAAAVLVLLAGPLIRFEILPWQAGLAMFAMAALLAGIGGAISLWQLLCRRGGIIMAVAAAAGLAALLIPVAIVVDGASNPRIHDLTTDTIDPPQFVAITPTLRGPGAAPVTYDSFAAPLQKKAFPKLVPLDLPDAPAAAFDKALDAARAMGWQIVASDAKAGRIEATDTVAWWGFHDDIVVRVAPHGTGSRIDVRSKSRYGEGDLGVNARRIGKYLGKLGKP